jgi:hypothetical protein
MLKVENQLAAVLNKKFEAERKAILEAANLLWESRAAAYDVEKGAMQRHPFGPQSFLHELSKKVGRLEACFAQGADLSGVEGLEDQLLDILNYAAAFAAYNRVVEALEGVRLRLEREA